MITSEAQAQLIPIIVGIIGVGVMLVLAAATLAAWLSKLESDEREHQQALLAAELRLALDSELDWKISVEEEIEEDEEDEVEEDEEDSVEVESVQARGPSYFADYGYGPSYFHPKPPAPPPTSDTCRYCGQDRPATGPCPHCGAPRRKDA